MLKLVNVIKEGPELDIVRTLFREYGTELNEDLLFQGFEQELEHPLKKYGPPYGVILLAYWSNEPAGCVALTPMPEPGVCEMKRLYVRAGKRKYGIGTMLVDEILTAAIARQYHTMRLDTLAKLQGAITMYKRIGFRNIAPYYDNPLPGAVYMEKQLI